MCTNGIKAFTHHTTSSNIVLFARKNPSISACHIMNVWSQCLVVVGGIVPSMDRNQARMVSGLLSTGEGDVSKKEGRKCQ